MCQNIRYSSGNNVSNLNLTQSSQSFVTSKWKFTVVDLTEHNLRARALIQGLVVPTVIIHSARLRYNSWMPLKVNYIQYSYNKSTSQNKIKWWNFKCESGCLKLRMTVYHFRNIGLCINILWKIIHIKLVFISCC